MNSVIINRPTSLLHTRKAGYERLTEQPEAQADTFDTLCRFASSMCCLPSAFDPARELKKSIRLALKHAEKGAGSSDAHWLTVHKMCLRNRIRLRDVIDRPTANGLTALERVVATRDMRSLHFLHACVGSGWFKPNIYLSDYVPSKQVSLGDCMGFGAQPPVCAKDFFFSGEGRDCYMPHGYGILTCGDGRQYVGHWRSSSIISFAPIDESPVMMLKLMRAGGKTSEFILSSFTTIGTRPPDMDS